MRSKLPSSLSLSLAEAGIHELTEEVDETEKKKRTAKLLAVFSVPILAAFIQGCILLSGGYHTWHDGMEVSRKLELYPATMELMRSLQEERLLKLAASEQ